MDNAVTRVQVQAVLRLHGYLTVTPDSRVDVSRRLLREFMNGRTYDPPQGAELRQPRDSRSRPPPEYRRWHNEKVFVA